MKIIAYTDFHGSQQAFRQAKAFINNEKPDLVIVGGDILNHDVTGAKQFLSELSSAGRPVYFVPGNMDGDELGDWNGKENIHALHGRGENFADVFIIGLGGSPHGPFKTVFEYSEEEASELLDAAAEGHQRGQLILVSHYPPRDTKVDQVSSGEHVGSTSVRKFVEQKQPVLVISGHVHEAQGRDKLGSTTVVNTGPALRGNCAIITLDNKEVEVTFSKFF